MNLGGVYLEEDKFDDSLACFKEALNIRKYCLTDNDNLISESVLWMGHACYCSGLDEDALQYYFEGKILISFYIMFLECTVSRIY